MNEVRFYKDDAGKWRWKCVAANNKVVADSGEGYRHKQDCADEAIALFGQSVTYRQVDDDDN